MNAPLAIIIGAAYLADAAYWWGPAFRRRRQERHQAAHRALSAAASGHPAAGAQTTATAAQADAVAQLVTTPARRQLGPVPAAHVFDRYRDLARLALADDHAACQLCGRVGEWDKAAGEFRCQFHRAGVA